MTEEILLKNSCFHDFVGTTVTCDECDITFVLTGEMPYHGELVYRFDEKWDTFFVNCPHCKEGWGVFSAGC